MQGVEFIVALGSKGALVCVLKGGREGGFRVSVYGGCAGVAVGGPVDLP